MADKSSLLLIPILTITVVLSLLISNVNAITVNTTFFSVNVSDNWAYTNSSNSIADVYGIGSTLTLIPTEFSHLFVAPSKNLNLGWIQNEGGAFSLVALDTDYPYRNVPAEIYTQYNVASNAKILSKANTTIDGEKAVKNSVKLGRSL